MTSGLAAADAETGATTYLICDVDRAYGAAAAAGLRRAAPRGEDTPASAIGLCVDALGAERIDHGLSVLGDPALVARLADERVPLTVDCAKAFDYSYEEMVAITVDAVEASWASDAEKAALRARVLAAL